MQRLLASLASVAAFAACLATPALASDVIVVDPSGPIPTIQLGVTAAAAGDVVLVRPGTYAEDVVVTGVGLSIVGDGSCRLTGTLQVSAVPANQSMLIGGLEVRPPMPAFGSILAAPRGAIDLRDCDGPVRIVDCSVQGAAGQVEAPGPNAPAGGPGMFARQCDDVAVIDTVVTGGRGAFSVIIIGGVGGSGVTLESVRRATLMRSVLTGGHGGVSDDGGDGGHGVTVEGNTTLHLDYSGLFGGDGADGDPSFSLNGGDGGDGLRAGSQTVWDFQSVFAGGDFGIGQGAGGTGGPGCCNGDPGVPFVTQVPMRALGGHPSRLELPLLVREGEAYTRRVSAVTGERIRHLIADATGFGFRPALRQPRLLEVPALALRELSAPIVSTEAFGELIENRVARPLAPGADAKLVWQQAVAVDSLGNERRTSARPLIVLRAGL